ncbi:MAG TPA: hypothetical protein VF773_22680 [Verrucomicrobiae bacterium]
MITQEIEAIFAGQDIGGGDVDIDGVLAALERLMSAATQADLPELVAAIQSPRNNFWTRELFAEPIAHLGGSDYLEVLFEAAQQGRDEGHDNDSLDTYLTEIAYSEPEKCRAKLNELLARPDYKHKETASWLLDFCKR